MLYISLVEIVLFRDYLVLRKLYLGNHTASPDTIYVLF